MPLEARRYIRAPITEAAGPLNIVSTGRFFISFTSITPPSPRMIISGTLTPVERTEDSVLLAVSIIFGRMLAFKAAVRVRVVSPYNLVMSDAMDAGRPISSAVSATSCSSDISSTPNALDATITRSPWSYIRWIIDFTDSRFISLAFIKSESIWMNFPVPRSMSGILVCRFARKPSRPPFPMPITPTFATSPSSSALVAWVVLWAIKITSSGLILLVSRHLRNESTTPFATPSSAK